MHYHFCKNNKNTVCRRCSKGPKNKRKVTFKIKASYCVACNYGKSSKRRLHLKTRKLESKSLRKNRVKQSLRLRYLKILN